MSFDIDVRRNIGGRDLRFAVSAGPGLTAIVGPSGAGKTSLLNMIAGLLKPDSGHIAVGGRTLFDSDCCVDLAPQRRRAGYVFQDRRLFPHMRVARNLTYGTQDGGGASRLDMGVADVVDFLGIGDLLDRWPATLSGGEIQRVAIGRALLSDPDFLLMDEPLGALDTDRREDIMTIIERLRDELRLPILYVSHDRAEVERLANVVIPLFPPYEK